MGARVIDRTASRQEARGKGWSRHGALGLAVIAIVLLARPACAAPLAVKVVVDPRVELMSVIFRLAGNPEYNRPRVPKYAASVEAQFRKHADHPAVKYAAKLRRTRGVSFDAVMSMAVHLVDVESMSTVVPLDPRPKGLDQRWQPAEAKAFLTLAKDFVKDSGFLAWFAGNRDLYAGAVAGMEAALKEHAQLGWIEAFFGVPPKARFELALGVLNGGGCYGPRVIHADGREDIHCVLGVWLVDAEGKPRFDKTVLPIVVHEFCHSYCNPLVDAHADALAPVGLRLWPPVAEQMKRQAYGGWKTMLYESLVRASVVRYMAAVEGEAGRRAQVADDKGRGFRWIEELSNGLAAYEKQREAYPTLGDFMGEVVKTLSAYAEAQERLSAAAPKVVAMTPANGATDVDPGLKMIRVTFDRPMRDGGWAFVGGGPNFPKVTGKPSYDEKRTTLTLPIELKPGWSYEFWLNRGRFDSFRSADGVPLAPVHVTFQTRKGP